jgi:glycine/D-amino acid oxidase-like deaminating enzyme
VEAVVVGAGTFGASLAWWLARSGDSVTLVDQFEPGDRRATSGGETRLYRCVHGGNADYTAMARRARTLWAELEQDSGEELRHECGVAWFAHGEDGWEADAERTLAAQGIPYERVDGDSLFPSFRGDDLDFVLFEPEAGAIRAQKAVQTLARETAAHGARIVRAKARPDGDHAELDDGTVLEGDVVVWACGPWLGRLFPGVVNIRVALQELLFFDGGPAWRAPDVPAWCDYDRGKYGTADIDQLGVKAAVDDEGPSFDPDAPLPGEPTTEAVMRDYLQDRFPALSDAPLLGARTCRYELTPDTNFIAAPHPEHANVWLVGGGSGHGFKHGPAMAERVAAAIRDGAALPDAFALGERQFGGSMRTAGARIST